MKDVIKAYREVNEKYPDLCDKWAGKSDQQLHRDVLNWIRGKYYCRLTLRQMNMLARLIIGSYVVPHKLL